MRKYSKDLAQNAAQWNSSRNTCHIWIPSAAVYSRNHKARANRLTLQHFMKTRAGVIPHLTNHSIRATTIESRYINASIQSYCDTPTFEQLKTMSSKLGEFLDLAWNENNAVAGHSFKPTAISNYKYFLWWISVSFQVHSRRLAEFCTWLRSPEAPFTTTVLISMWALEMCSSRK